MEEGLPADSSGKRVFLQIAPITIAVLLILCAIAALLASTDDEAPLSSMFAGMMTAAILILIVIMSAKCIFNPLTEKCTEHCTSTSLTMSTDQNGYVIAAPTVGIIAYLDANNQAVMVDAEKEFKFEPKSITIGDENQLTFDMVKYSETDYSIYEQKLTITAETAKELGLISGPVTVGD